MSVTAVESRHEDLENLLRLNMYNKCSKLNIDPNKKQEENGLIEKAQVWKEKAENPLSGKYINWMLREIHPLLGGSNNGTPLIVFHIITYFLYALNFTVKISFNIDIIR